MHSIFIEDLEVETIVGAYEHERLQPQTLTVNIEIGLATLIKEELASTSFKLLERLAEHLCERIEARFEISHIRLRIAKSGIVPGAKRVGVSLSRDVGTAGTIRAS